MGWENTAYGAFVGWENTAYGAFETKYEGEKIYGGRRCYCGIVCAGSRW
jgi:hypothetical protein